MEAILQRFGLEKAFARLQDDESREIFMHRLNFFLYGSYHNFFAMTYDVGYRTGKCGGEKVEFKQNPKNLVEFMSNETLHDFPVVLYGAGEQGTRVLDILQRTNIKVECFCDSDKDKQGMLFHQIQVIDPDMLIRNYKDLPIIITPALRKIRYEIQNDLIKNGMKDDMIFHNRIISYPFFDGKYFGVPFLHPVQDEIYIDAGCAGSSIERFINFCGGNYLKIYGFEPSTAQYENIVKRVLEKDLKRVELINKGVWDTSTDLLFADTGSNCSSFMQERLEWLDNTDNINGNKIKVETLAIDESIPLSEKVTLIKMDIEGSELKALEGAKTTIQKHKPRLAISLYHKPEDIVDIPKYLNELVPEYKFYLRHHSTDQVETVLYAIPEKQR